MPSGTLTSYERHWHWLHPQTSLWWGLNTLSISLDKDKSDGNENTLANDVTEKEKINAAPNEEAAAGGSEKVPIRSEDKSLDTKS